MHRRPLLLSVSAFAAGSMSTRSASAASAWRIATEYMSATMPGEGISCFAGAATVESDGTLAVSPAFDAPDGLRSATMPKAVADGKIQAADAFTGFMSGVAPMFELSALPFLTTSTEDARRLLEAARQAYDEALKARGLTLLYATPWPASGLWSREPLMGAAALRGLRVRTYDAASTRIFSAVGAAPTKLSFADTMPLLKAGVLDALLSSGDGGVGARLWEFLPHFTKLNYASPLSLAFCNASVLAALPDMAREAVMSAGAETEARQFRAIATRNDENEARMRANGTAVLESEELRATLALAAQPIVADWISRSGAGGAAILARFRS